MLRVSGDILTIPCMSSWSAVTNLQHLEHDIEGHRVLVFLISPSTVRNLLLPSERKPRTFRIGALLPFYVTQKFYLTKVTYLSRFITVYEGWNFNSGNYLFTTDTK